MDDESLTHLLLAYETAEPSAALRARIVAAAPRQRVVGRAWRWAAGLALGVGLAGSCAAGVAAGFTLTPASITRVITAPSNSALDANASEAGASDAIADPSSLADPAGDPADS